MEQNTVLKFVLDRFPIGLHIPCEVLGELWGSKAKFWKKVYTDAMDNLLAQFGVFVSEMNGTGRQKGIVLLGRARRSRSTRANSRWARCATWSAPEAPTVGS